MARIASGAAEKVEQVAPAEAKRRALTKDLTGTLTAEERAAKTKELRALLANDPGDASHFTADEMATKSHSDVEAWASTMRSRYGLEEPELYRLEPGEDASLHEGNALAYLARHGVEPAVAKALHADFYDALTAGVGKLDAAALDQLEHRYPAKLGAKVTADLRRWWIEEVGGMSS